MKNQIGKHKSETGQVIPIVVLMIVAIIAIVALILDGGSVMSNRRTAQAAADSGALAGAKQLCLGASAAAAKSVAEAYAINNKATTALASVTGTGVTVNTDVANPSFFAGIFGLTTLTAKAEAVAGCYSVSQAKVLPVAWACKKPVGESDSQDCQVNMLDWVTQMDPMLTGTGLPVKIDNVVGEITKKQDFTKDKIIGYLYVIMDSPKLNEDLLYTCADPTKPLTDQPGKIDCDLNNDQINEVLGHGERSWLDLDGGLTDAGDGGNPNTTVDSNGAKALKSWIDGVGVPPLAIHTWLGGQSGVASSIFREVDKVVVGKVALVPVFDGWCDTNPDSKPECIKQVHDMEKLVTPKLWAAADHEPIKTSPGADNYYHIIGFSAFYVTCVDDGGGANKCPGAVQLINDNSSAGGPWADKKGNIKIKSIEGYFINNYPFDLGNPGAGGADVGVHIVSLSK